MKREKLLHITTKHNGKMEGMQSLSTSCRQNPFCEVRSKVPGSICEKCYAQLMMKTYKQLDPCMQKNGEVLSGRVLEENELPNLNVAYFRFEAFGDLINENHVINYFNICKKNPDTHFALWTKNPFLISKTIKDYGYEKPDNLKIVLSSERINEKADISPYPFVDKVFTVYDKEFISENRVDINCGGRKCVECKACYTGDVVEIREQLKKGGA